MALIDFARQLEQQLAAANREPHWSSSEAEAYMASIVAHREEFEKLSRHLLESAIYPRVATLAGCFPNASQPKCDRPGQCACWFGYCERFPVSAKVEFAIEHDVKFENVAVRYVATMVPSFLKFNDCDALVCSVAEVSDKDVTAWTEQRLLEFVGAYLRVDRGGDHFEAESVNDPVCGMRISRQAAVASECFRGHPYFFCSPACHERFRNEPEDYLKRSEDGWGA